jgi:hypothetical protein
MTLSRVLVLLLVASVALSGCFGKGKTSVTTDSSTTTSAPSTSTTSIPTCDSPSSCGQVKPKQPHAKFELNDCTGFWMAYVADSDKIASKLPSGYTPQPLVGNVESVPLHVYQCDSMVADNRTVIRDFRIAYVIASVNVPPEVADPNQRDVYVLELIVNNATAAKLWQDEGFAAQVGTIEVQVSGQTIQGSVAVGGSPLYGIQGGGQTQPSSTNTSDHIRLHQDQTGQRHWISANSTYANTDYGSVGVLSIHGGAVGATASDVNGSATLVITVVTGRQTFEFPLLL